MKNTFLIISLVLLLGACAGSDTNPAETSPTIAQLSGDTSGLQSEPGPKRMRPMAAPEGDKGVDKLAAIGLALDFPHEINYDIIDQSKNGTTRHRVLIEVLEADFPAAVQQFDSSVVSLGYSEKDGADEDGRSKKTYVKKGAASLHIIAQPVNLGPNLKHPDASGSIHVMWSKGK